jgi:RES domain-containing protein
MISYRIAPKVHNDLHNALSGVGGLYAEGRWHYLGAPIVYSASSRSLGMLERLVNDSTDILTKELSVVTILIPDHLKIVRLVESDLPDNWDDHPYVSGTQKCGSDWLHSLDSAILQVPSSLCSDEYNFLFNPQHPDANKIECVMCDPYTYPRRLANKL